MIREVFHCSWCKTAPEGVDPVEVMGRCIKHGTGPSLMAWGWVEKIPHSEPTSEDSDDIHDGSNH